MNKQIRDAFDAVHAEERLKAQTKAFLHQKISGESPRPVRRSSRLVPILLCVVLLLTGCGAWTVFAPTATVSVDINPSLELVLNRFDRVLSVKGYNEDGQALADSLSLRFQSCEAALRLLLGQGDIAALLKQDEELTLTVVGGSDAQNTRVLDTLQTCTAGQPNTYCATAALQEVQDAHALGLSYGKYRIYLALKEWDDTITPEEVQSQTMRSLRERLEALQQNTSQPDGATEPVSQNNGNGQGNGQGNKNGKGQGPHSRQHNSQNKDKS